MTDSDMLGAAQGDTGEKRTVTIRTWEDRRVLERYGWTVLVYHDGTGTDSETWVMEAPAGSHPEGGAT